MVGFSTGIVCGAKAANVIINHSVSISSEDDRSKTA